MANEASSWIPSCRQEPLAIPVRAILHHQDNVLETELDQKLATLYHGVRRACTADRERNPETGKVDLSVIYDSAIPELRNVFCCLRRSEPDNFRGVIGWSAFVDASFVSLLKAFHPAALCVLAHYGVALHMLEQAWWLRGVGSLLLSSVATIIQTIYGEEWQELVQWPLGMVHRPVKETASSVAGGESGVLILRGQARRQLTAFETAFAFTYANELVDL